MQCSGSHKNVKTITWATMQSQPVSDAVQLMSDWRQIRVLKDLPGRPDAEVAPNTEATSKE